MNEAVAFSDFAVSQRFSTSIALANNEGWGTFKESVFDEIDCTFRLFVIELVLDSTKLRIHHAVSEESLALLISSFLPMTGVDRSAIKLIGDRYFFQPKERANILREGLQLCQDQIPSFYEGYRVYLEMIMGEDSDAYNSLLSLSWLVVLIIRKSYDLDPTLALCQGFE